MLLPTMPCNQDRDALAALVRRPKTQQRLALRARIVLLMLDGTTARAAAKELQLSPMTVRKWWRRYQETGLAGLEDAPRTGRPTVHADLVRRDLVALATSSPPSPYGTWTHTRLAAALQSQGHDVSPSWVRRALSEQEVKTHLVRGWLHRSNDPDFQAKVEAIEEAVAAGQRGERTVVCVDEKTAVPVRTPTHLDTQGPDGIRRREVHYRRKGTLTWYGVQDCTAGTVRLVRAAGRCDSQQFTLFLEDLVARRGPEVTIILDNGPAHVSKHTKAWLKAHPKVTVLYTPVHASWANPVETVFSVLQRQVINHGWFEHPDDLHQAAQQWVALRNRKWRPVKWTYTRKQQGGLRTSDGDH